MNESIKAFTFALVCSCLLVITFLTALVVSYLRLIWSDVHSLRESIAPEPVKVQMRWGASEKPSEIPTLTL